MDTEKQEMFNKLDFSKRWESLNINEKDNFCYVLGIGSFNKSFELKIMKEWNKIRYELVGEQINLSNIKMDFQYRATCIICTMCIIMAICTTIQLFTEWNIWTFNCLIWVIATFFTSFR